MLRTQLLIFFLLNVSLVRSQSCNIICNGGFDNTSITTGVALITSLPCWSTTASDGKMEVWGTGFNGVPSYSGSQFVELNATMAATMFQDFTVTSGTTYTLCFAHRGRAGVDSMAVSAGPPGGPYTTLGVYGDGTSAWGYYCVTFTPSFTGTYRIQFTPVYWSGGNVAIGNFLDAITVNGPGSFTVSGSATICPGGSATISASGATSYSWSTGSTLAVIVVSPSVTTSYSVQLTSSTCAAVVTRTVFVGTPLITTSNATICTGNSATVMASGAQTYTWSNGSTGPVLVVSPQSTTVYSVSASTQSCISKATSTVTVLLKPALSFSVDPGTCSTLGQATVQVLNAGPGSYTFSWMPVFSSGPMAFNLYAGSHSVIVTDLTTGCSSMSVTVIPPVSLSLTASGSTVCAGQSLLLSASSSTGVTYTWKGPNNFSSTQQNPVISNAGSAASGSYTVLVSSSSGCSASAVVNAKVTAPPSLSVNLSDQWFCALNSNGSRNSITITPSGATNYTLLLPVNFISNAGQNSDYVVTAQPPFSSMISAVSATLLGAVQGLCTASITTNFSVIPNPVLSLFSSTTTICEGDSFTYSVSGAQSFTWTSIVPNSVFYNNATTAIAKPPGSAPFSVFGSSLGCNSSNVSGSVTVIQKPLVTVSPASTGLCPGNSVELVAQGNASSYYWFPQTGINIATGDKVVAKPLTNTNYTVVASVFHCTSSAVATVSLLSVPAPTATLIRPRVCINDNATLVGEGGSFYLWILPDGSTREGKTVTFQVKSILDAGTYTLIVTDKNKCAGGATTDLTVDPSPAGALRGSDNERCVPFCASYQFISPGAAITSTWSLNGRTFPAQTFTQCYSTAGTFTLKGSLFDSITGCRAVQELVVIARPKPVADFSWEPLEPVEGLDEVLFVNQSSGEDQKQGSWFFSNDEHLKVLNDSARMLYMKEGSYGVALVAENKWGCKDTSVQYVKVITDFSMYVPNAFTPNNDSRNDIFMPVARGVKFYEMTIFDRWGELLFTTTELSRGWDATFKGEACKEDVYVWVITVTTIHGQQKQLSGSVSLMR